MSWAAASAAELECCLAAPRRREGPAAHAATDRTVDRWRSGARDMQNEMTASSSSVRSAPATVKRPTRIITYAWGARYVDTLLTLTLPALLAPGNLPSV